MALDETIVMIAEGIVDVVKSIKDDLELSDQDIYLHEVPQEFTLPACLVRLAFVTFIRLNPQQAQMQLTFNIEYVYPRFSEPERIEKLLKVLSTLMITILKNPTMNNTSFTTNTPEGQAGILMTEARDQGCEGISITAQAFEEPIDTTPIWPNVNP
jgi:hypothetical protein